MGKRQDSVARSDQDAGEACTSTTRSHADDNIPSTSRRSFRGFPLSSPNPYHQSHSSEANLAPVADFSAAQHRGGPAHEANVPPNPLQSESYMRGYYEGYMNGYYRAILSGAAVAQEGLPLVPAVSAVVPMAGLQSYAPSTLLYSATFAGSNISHQAPPATGASSAINSQALGWGFESGYVSQNFGRNRNPPALPTFQLDTLGNGSTSPPQAPVLLSSPTYSVVVVPQPVSGPTPGAQRDNESHECTWVECGKSFRRRYLLEDHVAYTHHGTKRHTCPAEGCGNSYAARTGLMKHVKKNHQGLVGTPVLSVDDVG